MKVKTLKSLEEALLRTRAEFGEATASIREILEGPVDLYFSAMNLTSQVAKPTDDELYAVEALATSFRRVISSLALLESGLPDEAHMVLRNGFELNLIAIDIGYNKLSLEQWKLTNDDDLTDPPYEDWYFKTSSIRKRIQSNESGIYPALERRMAIGTDETDKYSIWGEWKVISNKSLHAHSRAQIRKYFSSEGSFQLLGLKTPENYQKDFKVYRALVMGIISILVGIPKYRSLIGEAPRLTRLANEFARVFTFIQNEMIGVGTAIGFTNEGKVHASTDFS